MNADDPAFPYLDNEGRDFPGLTKREHIAIQLMAGMMSDPNMIGGRPEFAKSATEAAGALIAELNKPE